ncbi:MAG: thiol oxidoreductase [Bacteroidetes bacterium]|nr:thiol oxidoreductase [Bacteroidota bacterium]MCW5894805.1 thiol oxidoreductase [Bacteroidota bacterium]
MTVQGNPDRRVVQGNGMRTFNYLIVAACILSTIIVSCDHLLTKAPEESEVFEGPIDGLTNAQRAVFVRGDKAFSEVFTFNTGLGPLFNEASCERCHVGDGRGHPRVNLTRFGVNLGNGQFDPLAEFGGPQLQQRSMPGYPAETIPSHANAISVRGGPIVTGLGLIEAIPDQTILANADPNDLDGDGISGRPNVIAAPDFLGLGPGPHNGKYLGRFGRKAGSINLLHQTVVAYHQDMGITSDFLPEENFHPSIGPGGDPVPDPEVAAVTVHDVVFYLQTLRPAMRRNERDPAVQRGEQLFRTIKCVSCHVPVMMTGPHPVAALSHRPVHLYSDLLLHDMGPDLADNFIEGEASGVEWRTTPLWGLGIVENVLGGTPFYLHDGRTSDLRVVIDLHKGEANGSRIAFLQLSPADQDALIAFLRSL